jgi:hypothetical protein
MRLLRTAEGGFINAERIVRLAAERGGADDSWIAVLDDGQEVALARYYSAPGRIERDLPDLMQASVARTKTAAPMAACSAEPCCSQPLECH